MENARVMDEQLYKAAVRGDKSFLEEAGRKECDEEYYLRQTYQENNFLHIAVRHKRDEFINVALKSILTPGEIGKLICLKNCDGNTPLHVAAEVGNVGILEVLLEYGEAEHQAEHGVMYKPWRMQNNKRNGEAEHQAENGVTYKPWRMQNNKGNTPLHVALIHINIGVAEILVKKYPELCRVTNTSKETPLHLAVKFTKTGDFSQIMPIVATTTRTADVLQLEDSFQLLELLLEKDSAVACWRDANGLTPLLRAASLKAPLDVQVVKVILCHQPQSAEVCDLSGRTILHHLRRKLSYAEGREIFGIPELSSMKNHRDHQGNTPALAAVRNYDFNFVRVLVENSANFFISNDDGVSAADLLKHQKIFQDNGISEAYMDGIPKLTEEECQAIKTLNPEILGTILGDGIGYDPLTIFLSRSPDGRNILHLLMQSPLKVSNERLSTFKAIITASLRRQPFLMCQTDLKGNNPIHYLTRLKTSSDNIALLAAMFNEYYLTQKTLRTGSLQTQSPWRMKNKKGNTPLHEAFLRKNILEIQPALEIWKMDEDVIGFVNNRKETPLHLLADAEDVRSAHERLFTLGKLVTKAIEVDAVSMRDEGGLTPLLRAARTGQWQLIAELCERRKDLVFAKDPNGKTFWHMLARLNSLIKTKNFIELLENIIRSSVSEDYNHGLGNLECQDDEGNSSLHLALMNRHFDLAKIFIATYRKMECWRDIYLKQQNNNGESCDDLIATLQHLPSDFEKFLWDQGLFKGRRSVYGIPMANLEAYISTIGMAAALLATISFTAAFAVPGGLNQDIGTPILMRKVAFQVFMVSNVLALCFSMMVLFCLLWVMTTKKRKESILLLDTSIFLLLASFHATLFTFMMGVYVTTFAVTPWIGILACVLCCSLIVFMHKWFVITCLGPYCAKSIIWYNHHKHCLKQKVEDCRSFLEGKIIRWQQRN